MQLTPPDELVKQNYIGEGDFREIGDRMIHGLVQRGLVTAQSRILDVGCGLGRLARPLVPFLNSGEYYGLDINRSSIEWCKSNYAPHAKFHFEWVNAYSKCYNPEGQFGASAYHFPFSDSSFDFVMLTSVFTHMLFKDVEHYMHEVARVLRPDAACYIT